MNSVCISGYLLADADERVTTGGVLKLVCDVMVTTRSGATVPYRCVFADGPLVSRSRPYLTAGRTVVMECELDGHIYEERGVQKGWTRHLHVMRAEFPARSQPKEAEETAA